MWIKEIVESLVKKHGTNDPFEIANAKKIFVFERDLHDEVMGFYKYIRRNKFIYLNANMRDGEKKFTLAHELGHSEMHTNINTPFLKRKTFLSIDKIENEANRFAMNLLLYQKSLEEYETKYDLLRANGIPREMERYL